MYASRTVCSRCSSQLRSTPASASASVSAKRLGAGAAASYSTAAETRSPASSASRPNNTRRDSKSRHPGQRKGVNAFREKRQPDEDPALALFKEVVSPKEVETSTDTISVSTPLPIRNELEITALINDIMSSKMPMDKMYRVFQDEIWPSIKALGGHIPKPIYMATLQLLAKQRDYMLERGDYKNSLDIAEKYSALGTYGPSIRNDLIMSMCCRIVQVKNSSKERSEMRTELLNLWKHVSQLKRPSEVGKMLQFALPAVTEVMKDTKYIKSDGSMSQGAQATRALAAIFLQFPPPQAQEIVPALLATMAIASDKRLAGISYKSALSPLFFLVKSVLSEYSMTRADVEAALSNPSAVPPARLAELKEYVAKQWPIAVGMVSDARRVTEFHHDPEAQRSLANFHRQLRTAYRGRDAGAVGSIWYAMTAKLQDSPVFKAELAEDPDFLDFWVFVWCAVRRPARVQETINLMKSLKLEPTIRTYTSMMHGWKMCKDIGKIEMLWDQLIKSGTKLDSVIWTERVSALIELGQHQKGLEALSELLDNWRQAVKKGTQDQAVEPNIETVNAAFKGLLHTDPKAAHELLGWAGKQGLEPNTRTYNILIRETIRMGHHEEINQLLRSMQTHGIEPDSATFTILLETVIGSMHDASAEEQVTAIKSVFSDIEQAGLKPNLETYGKMLYALDGLPNCSDDVVAALQQHMRGNGFGSRLTPHMITILIERALRHNPPDMNKVRSLLKENNLTTVSSGDQTLWERVTTAHAISGNIKEAMAIFDDLAASGRPVTSLPCLTELILALLEHGDKETAKRVVDIVVEYKLNNKDDKDANHRYWRHHFWYMAQHNGLVDGQKLRQYSRG
ncbi:glutathione s-transferase [Fusarium sporotrichioides]|uniref:Glutathione s-transferase n=1 Tax=Fusarium sporotrichioides TaxID=5514 RepID=A0A395RSM6_FUSSP|nr:glutathione s-transferase [Fusarium sporotrichioides]